MKTIKQTGLRLMMLTAVSAMILSGCKKDKNDPVSSPDPTPTTPEKKYALVIDNGAQSIEQGKSVSYSAHLVSTSGAIVNPSGISWSSTFGGFSSNTLSFNQDTTGFITASVSYEGNTYTAKVPVSIMPVKSTQLFAVVPSAIIWSTGAGDIQLNSVYLGGSATYTYVSENTGIVTVSNTGLVSFVAAGNTNIRVSATINGQLSVIRVPVMVVGVPEVKLPVAKVVVTPALGQMFKGETLQLNAKAYDSDGNDVSNNFTFTYTVVPKVEEDGVVSNAITVNNSGLVSAVALGGAYVQVKANGVMGQSEIVVNPDTVILVNPFYAQLGGFDPITMQPGPSSKIFTATTYKVDRNAYKAGSPNFLTQIANPAGLTWMIPQTGIAEIDNLFNVITLSNANNTSVTANMIQGKVGSTFVVASANGIYFGAGSVMVMP